MNNQSGFSCKLDFNMNPIGEKNIHKSCFEFDFEFPQVNNVAEYFLNLLNNHISSGKTDWITDAVSGDTTSYQDVLSLSARVASHFHKNGFQDGDVLIYSSHNASKIHTFLLGVWRANGIVRSSYPEDSKDSLLDQIITSKSKWLLCDQNYAKESLQILKTCPWDVKVIIFGENVTNCLSVDEFLQDDGSALPQLRTSLNDTALILPTSGTTGKSKGAFYTHRSLLKNVIMYQNFPFTDKPECFTIMTSKQTHYIGCVCAFSCLAAGKRLLTMNGVTVPRIIEAVKTYKPYSIVGFPKIFLALVNDPLAAGLDLTCIQRICTGGQSVGPSFFQTVRKYPNLLSCVNFYGMTECGLLASHVDWNAVRNGCPVYLQDCPETTVGKLPPNTTLKVVDLQTGDPVNEGEPGELMFKSPLVCDGYWNEPEKSAEAFPEKWVKTGDVGIYRNGFIFIVDRIKEIFKYYNNHISPTEIENVILQHEDVSEAMVVGIEDPDGGDTIPKAFVKLKHGCTTSVEELIMFTNEKLASYKHLRGGMMIINEIPVGKTGKVSRSRIKELYC